MFSQFNKKLSASLFYGILLATMVAPLAQSSLHAAEKIEQVTDGNTQKRMLSSFKKLHIEGDFQVHIHEGDEYLLKIEGDPTSFPLLSSRISNDTLTIKPKKPRKAHSSLSDFPALVLHISGRNIEEITFIGKHTAMIHHIAGKTLSLDVKGHINGEIHVKVEELKCKVFGDYDLKFMGSATDANFSLYGAGTCNAQNMQIETCKLIAHGTGEIHLNVHDKLGGKLTGTNRLIYSGQPKAKISAIGTAQAHAAEDMPAATPAPTPVPAAK